MGVGVSLAVFSIPVLLEYLNWQNIWAILGSLCLIIAGIIKRYLQIDSAACAPNRTTQPAPSNTSFWQIIIGGIIPTTVVAISLQHAPRANAVAASMGLVLQLSACAQFFGPPLSAALVSTTQNWAYIAAVTASLSILGILMTLLLFKRYAQ